MNSIFDKYILSNGVEIPCIGFGTYKSKNGAETTSSVLKAFECGYRLIDTAALYGNERSVGNAVRESGLSRQEVFVTSKVWNTRRGYDNTIKAFNLSLKSLKLDYMDMFLIHWPANSAQYDDPDSVNLDTWRALTDLYKEGLVKVIGVCNFLGHHLKPLLDCEIKPMVNQIEFHPGYMQKEVYDICMDNNIRVEGWSPLGRGEVLQNPVLLELAAKYGCTTAQLCLRWCIQHKVIPLPKSVTPERISSNTDVFFFSISDEDMKQIDEIPFCGGSGHNPDTVDF